MAKNKRTTRTIKWQDPESNPEWQSIEAIKTWCDNPKHCTNTGRVIYENDELLVISNEKNGLGEWGNKTLIFKSLIIK